MSIHDQDRLLVKQRLAAHGIVCGDLYALLKEPDTLRKAAPHLLELLTEISSPIVKTDLVRVASSANTPPKLFVDELRRLRPVLMRDTEPSQSLALMSPSQLVVELNRIRAHSSGTKSLAWALADALSASADSSVFNDLVDLIRDKQLGRARQMLPYALARVKSRRQEAVQILLQGLVDEEIASQVLDALVKMKAVEAIPAIQEYSDSPVPLVRRSAARALRILEEPEESSAPSPALVPRNGLLEVSTNFDLERVSSFLAQLARLVEGFGPREIDQIEARLLEMNPDEEQGFNFEVRYGGEEVPLQISIYMSDVDAPDVAFISTSKLAGAIELLIDSAD